MFLTECARLAEQYPNLAGVFEQIDSQLKAMGTAEVIRSDDLASFLNIDPNQIRSALDMLAKDGVLLRVEMIECRFCQMAAIRSEYEEALDEDDEYRCTSCDRPLTNRTIQIITAYRRGEKWRDRQSNASSVDLDEQTRNAETACIFRKGTKVWTLSFDGATVHLPHLVGISYIAELLRHARSPIASSVCRYVRASPYSRPRPE